MYDWKSDVLTRGTSSDGILNPLNSHLDSRILEGWKRGQLVIFSHEQDVHLAKLEVALSKGQIFTEPILPHRVLVAALRGVNIQLS